MNTSYFAHCIRTLTVSLLLPNNVLALPVQELQMICHHPLLAFMDDFAVGAGVQVLPTSHLFVFQSCQNLQDEEEEGQKTKKKEKGQLWFHTKIPKAHLIQQNDSPAFQSALRLSLLLGTQRKYVGLSFI